MGPVERFHLAALLGLAAVVAGRVAFHRRVVLLGGVPGVWVAAACLLTVAGVFPPAAGLALAALALVPYMALLGMRRSRMERLRLPRGWTAWLVAAVHEEETELSEAIRPRMGTWPDAAAAAAALVTVVVASITMERAATALGRRYSVPDIIIGAVVLAVVTSLPNAVSAVYLARRGRGAAVLSTALNSNAINVTAGLLIPATLIGLGSRSGQDVLVAAWYAGLTVLALALAYRGSGLGRLPGAVIIGGYLAFTAALTVTVDQHAADTVAAVILAAVTAAAGVVVLAWPAGGAGSGLVAGPVAAGVAAARLERRPPLEAHPHPMLADSGLRRGQRPAPGPDRLAGRRPVLRAADRPVCADRRGQLLRGGAFGRARRPLRDLRHRHPVRPRGRRRGRRRDCHRRRGGPPASQALTRTMATGRASALPAAGDHPGRPAGSRLGIRQLSRPATRGPRRKNGVAAYQIVW